MCVRSPFLYDTPFLLHSITAGQCFNLINRIMRRCSMFLDLNMAQPIASDGAKGYRGGWGQYDVPRAIRLIYDIVSNRKHMSGSRENMSWNKPQRKIRFHEGFIRDCGCGTLHEILYICYHHRLMFKSMTLVN